MRKNKINKQLWTATLFSIILTLVGCTTTSNTQNLTEQSIPNDELLHNIRDSVLQNDEVYDAVLTRNNEQIIVAYKVKHLHRFKLNKIAKKVNQQLKNEFSEQKLTLSDDYKIFLEVSRLNKKIADGKVDKLQLNDGIKKIIKLKKEQT